MRDDDFFSSCVFEGVPRNFIAVLVRAWFDSFLIRTIGVFFLCLFISMMSFFTGWGVNSVVLRSELINPPSPRKWAHPRETGPCSPLQCFCSPLPSPLDFNWDTYAGEDVCSMTGHLCKCALTTVGIWRLICVTLPPVCAQPGLSRLHQQCSFWFSIFLIWQE